MTGLKDLLASERGVLAILAIVAATVLCALGKISDQEWLLFAGGVTGVTTISKTFTGVAEIKNPKALVSASPDGAVAVVTPPGGGS